MSFDLKTHEGRIAALEQIANEATDSMAKINAVGLAASICTPNGNGVELTEAQEEKLASARKEFLEG